ncbi:MAG: hypothetical protein OJF49_000270 [Ktedonobacterales bacterium]|jgi:ribosomal protein S18 acetylase RimI-like enzyme|nr:MAG: hypothetical protein OJF49_000270 [Ktedonobacterales bacterium]
MDGILRDATREAVIAAIEENEVAYWLYRARIAGWQVHEDAEITWYQSGGGSASVNGVLRTHLSKEHVEERIAGTIAHFATQGLPFTWWSSPSRMPADLGQRLCAAGLAFEGDDPAMAADLTRMAESIPAPEGVTIERARSDDEVYQWRLAFRAANSVPPNPEAAQLRQYAPASYGDDEPFRLYTACLHGEPVATSQLQLGAGVAGIYCVATAPHARRRGIGAAVTLAAMRDARALGYQFAVLGATEMGARVYRRIGFEQYSTLSSYTWHPDADVL